MSEKIKHIFPSLDPKEEVPAEELLRGTGLRETRTAILRRMILEILPKIQPWITENLGDDPQALQVIQAVKREKSNYQEVHEAAWNRLLEDITGYTPEVHLWKNPPEGSLWLANPQKNPFSKRAKELVECNDEDTLLIGWHQYCGVIACEILQGNKPIYREMKTFPKPRTIIRSQLYSKEETGETPQPNTVLEIWAWDKRNFEEQL